MAQEVDPWVISAPELFGFDAREGFTPPLGDAPKPQENLDLPPAQLVMQFESLGDNCEFGLVQRYAGAEPLGLFRFSFEKTEELLAVLENRFASLAAPDAVEIFFVEQDNEYMVRLNPHGFEYHLQIYGRDTADPDVLRAKEIRRVAFLADKLISDLENAEKILVRKGDGCQTEADAVRLLETLHRYGPNTLLWITPADSDHPPGTVEVARPYLLRGYIGHLAPYNNAFDLALAEWLDICDGAYRLWKTSALTGARIDPPPRAPAPNLIEDAATQGGSGWRKEGSGETAPAPLPLRPDRVVMAHALTGKTDFRTGFIWGKSIEADIAPGEIHTLSAWVYIPSNFRGTGVSMVCAAFPSLKLNNARLAIRDQWQQAWVSARFPDAARSAFPGLLVAGEPGDVIYSTCWKLEVGVVPTPEP